MRCRIKVIRRRPRILEMKNKHLPLAVIASALVAGCSNEILCGGHWMTPEAYANHRLDGDYARLLALYQSGAIDGDQLASRQQALHELQERVNREKGIPDLSIPDPFPTNSTPDCMSRDARHR